MKNKLMNVNHRSYALSQIQILVTGLILEKSNSSNQWIKKMKIIAIMIFAFSQIAFASIPVVVSTSPAHNATNVNINSTITVTYDQPIEYGIAVRKLSVRYASTGVLFSSIKAIDLLITGNTITFDAGSLPYDTDMYVTLDLALVKNSAFETSAFYGGSANWFFTTESDTYAPVLSSMNPPDNSVGIFENSNILRYSFNEDVQAGSGNIIVRRVDNDAVALNADVTNPSDVILTARLLTIVSTSTTFDYSTEYYVEFPSGVIEDLVGNPFAGIGASPLADHDFTMRANPDNTAPAVSFATPFSPADGAISVSTSTDLVINFNEDMQIGTGTIFVRNSSGVTVQSINVATASISSSTATIPLTSNLGSLTGYYVMIASGVFQDLAGNNYAGISNSTTWNFTTINADVTPPSAISFVPTNNAIEASVSANLTLTFDENIQLTGSAVLKNFNTNAVIPSASSASGAVLTINPTSNLSSETQYYVEIASGVIKDVAGNSFAGFSTSTAWNFTTIAAVDVTPPSAVTYVPLNNATGVSISNNLTLSFNETIQLTGSAVLKDFSTNAVIPSSSAVSGSVLTINPTANLSNSTQYYVTIANGVIKDVAGNSYTGFNSSTTWNFTTVAAADITPPSAVTYIPTNNATGVAVGANLVVTFNENVQPITSGGIQLKIGAGVTETFVLPNAKVVFSGSTVTINPTNNLNYGLTYHIVIHNNSLEDIAGNNLVGFTDATTWNFTAEAAPDVTPPSAVTYVPTDNAPGVSISNNLTLTFDENIQLTGTAVLKNFAGTVIPSTSTVSGNTLTINPTVNLSNSTQYYVTIAYGVIKDIAGNSYAGFSSSTAWDFTTVSADVTAPTFSVLNPTDNATGIATNNWGFAVSFDENIQNGSGTINLRKSSDDAVIASAVIGSSLTFISSSTLTISFNADGGLGGFEMDNSAEYYIEIPSGTVEDLAGNAFTGIAKPNWSFTTAAVVDVTAPVVTALSPTDGSNTAHILTNLIITFDEAVQKGSGIFTIRDDNDALIQNINVLSSTITVDGMTVTINPTVSLADGKSYYLTISNGALEDLSANDFVMVKGDWAFSTAATDIQVPSIVTLNPTNGAIGRDLLNNNLFMTFDENVQGGAGNVYVRRADNDVIAITKAGVSLSNLGTATIFFSAGGNVLEYGTEYYVEVEATALTDIAGNAFGGIAKLVWHFTTEAAPDVTAPAPVTYVPADNAPGVSISNNLTLSFNEIIQLSGSAVLKNFSTNAVIPSSSSVSGSVLTINPTANLSNSTQYYVTIVSGVIKDVAGNSYTGFSSSNAWNFTTTAGADVTPPTASTFTPLNNAPGVSISNNLTLSFNENIQLTGSAVLKDFSTNAVIPSSSSVSGSTLTINPTANLTNSTQYYVEIANGVVQDVAGNDYAGFSGSSTWNFTTETAPDNTAPALTSLSPVNNAPGIAVTTRVFTLTFDENVIKQTSGAWYVELLKNGIRVDFLNAADNISVLTVTGNTAVIDFSGQGLSDFDYDTDYALKVVNLVEDAAGNIFSGWTNLTSWNFTTGALVDVVAPTASTFTPLNNATGVSISNNLTLSFNETIQLTGSAVLKNLSTNAIIPSSSSVSGSTLTINPTSNLTNSTQYYVEIASGVVQDVAGNDYAGFSGSSTWNFTTEAVPDNTSPMVSAKSPLDNATNVLLNEVLTLTFDEDIMIAIGGNTKQVIIRRSNGSDFEVVPLTTANIVGNTLTIPHAAFEYNQGYYIYMLNGVIADLSNNYFGGMVGNYIWNFTTEAAPILTVTADNKTITYGDAIPSLSSTITGYVNGDDATAISTEPTISTTATNISDAGIYDITLNGGVADNYSFSLINGILTITKANQTINITAIGDKLISAGTFSVIATSSLTDFTYSIQSGPASISASGVVTLNGTAGTVEVKVTQAGGTNYNAASATIAFNVSDPTLTDQTITFNPLANKSYGDAVILSASSSSPLVVSYSVVSGPATVPVSGNTVTLTGLGTVVIEASQTGNATFNPATPVQQSFDVTKTTLTVTADNKTIGYSDAIPTLTYSYSGFVNSEDATALTAEPSISTVATNSSNVGSYDILLSGGVADNYTLTLVNGSLTINKADQTISITTIADKLTTDPTVNVVASTTSSLALTYSVTGPASISGTTITLDGTEGLVTVTVSQTGDANFNAATAEATFNVAVPAKADQTITITAIADKVTTDVAFDVVASTTSDLDLTFSVTGPATIAGTTITLSGVSGTVNVTVDQAGDDSFNAATAEISFDVTAPAKADQTITITAIADKVTTDVAFDVVASTTSDLDLTYSVTGPASISGTTITLSGVSGTVNVTVDQAGDDSFNAATAEISFDVTAPAKADQTITITAIADKVTADVAFDVVASTTSDLDLTYSVTGPASISGTTITLEGTAGRVTVTVSQAGDDSFNSATAEVSFDVTETAKSDQTITFDAISDNVFGGGSFELNASSTSGLEITYVVVQGNITISGSTVTITGAGAVIIAASQAGNDDFNAAAEVTQSFDIAKADQTITITAIDDKNIDDGSLEVVATTDSELDLTYEVSGPASINGTTITLSGETGEVIVTVSQAGNDNINSASETVSFMVDIATGIEDEKLLGVSIYPNPVSNWLRIDSNNSSELKFAIYSQNGKLINYGNISESTSSVDVRYLDEGIYILKIISQQQISTTKILINR